MDKEEAAPAAFISGKRDKLWMPRPHKQKNARLYSLLCHIFCLQVYNAPKKNHRNINNIKYVNFKLITYKSRAKDIKLKSKTNIRYYKYEFRILKKFHTVENCWYVYHPQKYNKNIFKCIPNCGPLNEYPNFLVFILFSFSWFNAVYNLLFNNNTKAHAHHTLRKAKKGAAKQKRKSAGREKSLRVWKMCAKNGQRQPHCVASCDARVCVYKWNSERVLAK